MVVFIWFYFFFFFARWLPIGTLGCKPTGSLPYPRSYTAIQPHYRGLQYCSVLPLSFDSDPSLQSPRSAFLSFPTSGIHADFVPTFPSLHHISCMRDSLLSSSCAPYNAEWYVQLWALPIFCNVSCLVYLWTKHTYRLVPLEIIGRSCTFHKLSIPSFLFSYPIYYFGLNLLKDSCRKSSGLKNLVPAPFLASLSVVSFY